MTESEALQDLANAVLLVERLRGYAPPITAGSDGVAVTWDLGSGWEGYNQLRRGVAKYVAQHFAELRACVIADAEAVVAEKRAQLREVRHELSRART